MQMADILVNVGLVGKKMVEKVKSFLPCTPYSIYDCTIDRYVSIVIEGQYRKILKRGVCSKEKQIEFINQLCFEFGQAKDDVKWKADNHDRENLFELNNLRFALSYNLFILSEFNFYNINLSIKISIMNFHDDITVISDKKG